MGFWPPEIDSLHDHSPLLFSIPLDDDAGLICGDSKKAQNNGLLRNDWMCLWCCKDDRLRCRELDPDRPIDVIAAEWTYMYSFSTVSAEAKVAAPDCDMSHLVVEADEAFSRIFFDARGHR